MNTPELAELRRLLQRTIEAIDAQPGPEAAAHQPRDADYRRAVEEAARRGAHLQTNHIDGYWVTCPNNFCYWEDADYRIAPEPEKPKPREWWISPNYVSGDLQRYQIIGDHPFSEGIHVIEVKP